MSARWDLTRQPSRNISRTKRKKPDGKTLGRIDGGCSEGEVILASRNLLDEGSYMTLQVDMTGDVAADEGMVCGGIMDILIETNPVETAPDKLRSVLEKYL